MELGDSITSVVEDMFDRNVTTRTVAHAFPIDAQMILARRAIVLRSLTWKDRCQCPLMRRCTSLNALAMLIWPQIRLRELAFSTSFAEHH